MSKRSSKVMGVGIVGAGSANVATQQHLPAIRQIRGLRVVALYDRDMQGARHFASLYDAVACPTLKDLCARDDIEQIHICSPDPFHAEQTIVALEFGKHVLVQKPMALTLADARAMCQTAERVGRKLSVCHNLRWVSVNSATKQAISTGCIGLPVHIWFRKWGRHFPYSSNSWYRSPQSSQFVHNGPHYVDLVCWLMDDLPLTVFARSLRRYPTEDALASDNFVSALYSFARAGQANVELNQLMLDPPAFPEQTEMVVIGTRGRLQIGGPRNASLQCFREGKVNFPSVESGSENPFVALIRDFTDAIREDREPDVTPRYALRVTEACLGAVLSTENGCVVSLGGMD